MRRAASEARSGNPKSEVRKKAETRNPKAEKGLVRRPARHAEEPLIQGFGIRNSFGLPFRPWAAGVLAFGARTFDGPQRERVTGLTCLWYALPFPENIAVGRMPKGLLKE
jgi:hypothetical protein